MAAKAEWPKHGHDLRSLLVDRSDKSDTHMAITASRNKMASGACKGHRSAESRTLLLAQGKRGTEGRNGIRIESLV